MVTGFVVSIFLLILTAGTALAYEEEVYWDNTTACWDDTGDAQRYQVQLYRGSEKIATRNTTGISYNFRNDMTQSGNYRFRVRDYVDGAYEDWSAYSDYISVTVQKRNNSSSSNRGNTGSSITLPDSGNSTITLPGSGNNSSDSKNNSTTAKADQRNREIALNKLEKAPYREGWQNDNGRWWYQNSDGSRIKDRFASLDGKWYNFDENGYMRTGWYKRGETWFYLKPDGAMALGWEQVDGKWYYLDPESGFMLSDTVTPDGYRVGADGAMLQ